MRLFHEEKGMALMLTLLILLVVLASVAAVNKSVATQVKVDAAFPDSQGALTFAEDGINVVLAYLHKGTYTIPTFPVAGFQFSTPSGSVLVQRTNVVGNSCTLTAIYTAGATRRTVAVDIDVSEDLKETYHIDYNGAYKNGEIGPFVQFVEHNYKYNGHGHRVARAVWGYFNHTGATKIIYPGTNTNEGKQKVENYFFPAPEIRPDVTMDGHTYSHPFEFKPGDYYNVFVTEWDEDDDNNHAEKWFLYGRLDVANNGTTNNTQYYVDYTVTTNNWRELTN